MLKRLVWGMVLILWLFLPIAPAEGGVLEELPNPHQSADLWVLDQAEMLTPATEATLNHQIAQLYAQTGDKMIIATLPDLPPGQTSRQVALALFDRWSVDDAARTLGVLMLIVKGDRTVEIQTGIRSIALLPDHQLDWIVQRNILPRFRQGQFDQGVLFGTAALIRRLRPQPGLPTALKILGLVVGIGGFAIASRQFVMKPRQTFEGLSEDNFREALHCKAIASNDSNDTYTSFNSCGSSDGGSHNSGGASGHW
jgi:uncharacterized protein